MYTDNNDIRRIRVYGKVISSVRYGLHVVWQAIRSCFGAGYWRGDKPWVGDDAWKG